MQLAFSDDEDEVHDALPLLLCDFECRDERTFRSRLIWDDHVQQLVHENMFDRTYRMPVFAFNALIEKLRPTLQGK